VVAEVGQRVLSHDQSCPTEPFDESHEGFACQVDKTLPVISVDLLVLHCADIERSRAFYELIGITFVREQHGTGPEHFAAVLGGITIELYPASPKRPPEVGLRIGLKVADVDAVVRIIVAAGHQEREVGGSSFVDPDGRIVICANEGDDVG
jgi:catechol 2,3-dioxygenase-like lactoylglutathione lyase family enzyme